MIKCNVLFPKVEIQQAINNLAHKINEDYRDKELIVMGVLNGGVYFTTDLTRLLTVDHQLTFVQLTSYGNERKSSEVKLVKSWNMNIVGKDVLIVEDILDSGKSMECLLTHIEPWAPKSVKVASLLYKSQSSIKPNYYCFKVKNDQFLVGYGLDDKGRSRNLDHIFELVN